MWLLDLFKRIDPLDIDKLSNDLKSREGYRSFVYDDANDEPIVKGYTVKGTPTLGYGTNVTTGITQEEADYLLLNRIEIAVKQCGQQVWWNRISNNGPRSRAVIELVFNMGLGGFNRFSKMITAIQIGDFVTASNELINSVAEAQEPTRIKILAYMLKNGVDFPQ